MRFCFFLLMSGALASAQMHDVHYQGELTPLNVTLTFDHGYVVSYDSDRNIDVYAPTAHFCTRSPLTGRMAAWPPSTTRR